MSSNTYATSCPLQKEFAALLYMDKEQLIDAHCGLFIRDSKDREKVLGIIASCLDYSQNLTNILKKDFAYTEEINCSDSWKRDDLLNKFYEEKLARERAVEEKKIQQELEFKKLKEREDFLKEKKRKVKAIENDELPIAMDSLKLKLPKYASNANNIDYVMGTILVLANGNVKYKDSARLTKSFCIGNKDDDWCYDNYYNSACLKQMKSLKFKASTKRDSIFLYTHKCKFMDKS